jgi:hypothetical protein
MKIKKQILGLLLSAFVFITFHDFIIGYIDADTQSELYLSKIEKVPLCESSTLHELIHHSLMTTLFENRDCPYFDNINSSHFIDAFSYYHFLNYHKLFRPPIA